VFNCTIFPELFQVPLSKPSTGCKSLLLKQQYQNTKDISVISEANKKTNGMCL